MSPEIPLSALDRIIRHSGANRVSTDASESLRRILEEVGIKISKKAVELTKHRNQQTISGDDILIAFNLIKDNL